MVYSGIPYTYLVLLWLSQSTILCSYVFAHFHQLCLLDLDTGDKHEKFMCWFLRGLTGSFRSHQSDQSNLAMIFDAIQQLSAPSITSIFLILFLPRNLSSTVYKAIGNPFLFSWGLLPVVILTLLCPLQAQSSCSSGKLVHPRPSLSWARRGCWHDPPGTTSCDTYSSISIFNVFTKSSFVFNLKYFSIIRQGFRPSHP